MLTVDRLMGHLVNGLIRGGNIQTHTDKILFELKNSLVYLNWKMPWLQVRLSTFWHLMPKPRLSTKANTCLIWYKGAVKCCVNEVMAGKLVAQSPFSILPLAMCISTPHWMHLTSCNLLSSLTLSHTRIWDPFLPPPPSSHVLLSHSLSFILAQAGREAWRLGRETCRCCSKSFS